MTPTRVYLPALLLLLSACLLVRTAVGLGVVSGLSMWPTLAPGDIVVFVRGLPPVEGSIVVAELPGHGLIIKRLAAAGGHAASPAALRPGYCLLLGDNESVSFDSRAFGPLPLEAVIGRVVAVWPDRLPRMTRDALPGSAHPR